jgi:hypothetical protein
MNEKEQAALDDINAAIGRALAVAPVVSVLSFVTGAFTGLAIELVRREGHDASKDITIDGGPSRDITIHAKKEKQ